VSQRWARLGFCAVVAALPLLFGGLASAAPGHELSAARGHEVKTGHGHTREAQRLRPLDAGQARQQVAKTAAATTPLTLTQQTPWVTAAQPWFNLGLGVNEPVQDASSLHASLTFYSRVVDGSQFQQSLGSTPQKDVLLRMPDVPVESVDGHLVASACVTVLPDTDVTPPASGPEACAGGGTPIYLGCTPLNGTCGGVYPVSVALVRQGSTVARFTTFLTYEEPSAEGNDGPLRVATVLPVGSGSVATMASALAAHRGVATTLAVSPRAVEQVLRSRNRVGLLALGQLASLDSAEVLDQPYVPVNVAALTEAGIAGEIQAQFTRGDTFLHLAGLRPTAGPWADVVSSFSQGDAADLASGLQVAGASQLVLDDADLAQGSRSNYTFAQPFDLDVGHGPDVPTVATDTTLGSRFTAEPGDPVLEAEQLLAGLSWVHYEDAFLTDHRGVVVTPPQGWQASTPFVDTLLTGLIGNSALQPVTVQQLFAQVPVGGNSEPSTRRLQSGPAGHGISHTIAARIAAARVQLSSYSAAVAGHPTSLTTLSDALLASEARSLSPSRRDAALDTFGRDFAVQLDQITLATERTVTFTSKTAPIPITVRSDAPYPVHVVISLASDKFLFPNGSSQSLTLDRATTSVRMVAEARTSGDRLPIDVTLRTPDGQLILARTVLTVHSTAISLVGVALTVLAGAVLLAWWVRTWHKSRRRRPRAT
jgi:Family of unknown function (DUF6049)